MDMLFYCCRITATNVTRTFYFVSFVSISAKTFGGYVFSPIFVDEILTDNIYLYLTN